MESLFVEDLHELNSAEKCYVVDFFGLFSYIKSFSEIIYFRRSGGLRFELRGFGFPASEMRIFE